MRYIDISGSVRSNDSIAADVARMSKEFPDTLTGIVANVQYNKLRNWVKTLIQDQNVAQDAYRNTIKALSDYKTLLTELWDVRPDLIATVRQNEKAYNLTRGIFSKVLGEAAGETAVISTQEQAKKQLADDLTPKVPKLPDNGGTWEWIVKGGLIVAGIYGVAKVVEGVGSMFKKDED